jgi:phage terminase large subunit-like protein
MAYYRVHTTVDLAGMEEQSEGAYTALTTCGFLPGGSIHVIDIRHGHFTPFEVIEHFFDIQKRYRPIDFKMEKNHHAQVLEPFLRQEMDKRGIFLNVLNIPRDNTVSKDNRISGVQPFLKTGRLRIVDDLPCDTHLILEITRFPKFKFKDILDTISDQLQHADGDGIEPDLYPIPKNTDNRSVLARMANPKFEGWVNGRPVFAGVSDTSEYFHEGTGL